MPDPTVRPSVAHYANASPQDRDDVEYVCACAESFERGLGVSFRENNVKRFRQYRGFRRWRDAWTKAGPNDKDAMLYDAKQHWGAALHIPLSYRTIEAMVPRAIAHRPRMLYLPREERWEANVEPVRLLIDSQQEQVDIDLGFQAVMRSGRIYGLGVGKCFWHTEYAPRRRVKRNYLRLPGQGDYRLGRMERSKVFDDPDFEDVDVFDFMWDPFGSEISRGTNRCGWVVHRIWLSTEAVMDRLTSGQWNTDTAKALTEDDVRRMGGRTKYDEVWADRMEASGLPNTRDFSRGEQPHEILEHHNGAQVLSVLDRQALVQSGENPCLGKIPFQAYRPTPLQYQMVGIGDLEPLEHLQRELDTFRSQARDAATLALAPALFFDDSAIEEDEITLGPAVATRVTNARPSDAVYFAPKPDLPASYFNLEQSIRADIDAVVGYNDSIQTEQGGQIGTATEAQLVQASLSKRIELSSRRFEIEVVRHAAQCFLHLDQRMILQQRSIRRPAEGLTYEQAVTEGRWHWFQVDPGMLQGDLEAIPEGGSMAAPNVAQDRADAQLGLGLMNNPYLDQQQVMLWVLKKLGVRDPQGWLKKSDPPVPPMALKMLADAGVDQRLIDFAVQRSQQQDPRLPDEGPNVQQVDQAMNGNGAMAGAGYGG